MVESNKNPSRVQIESFVKSQIVNFSTINKECGVPKGHTIIPLISRVTNSHLHQNSVILLSPPNRLQPYRCNPWIPLYIYKNIILLVSDIHAKVQLERQA